MVGHLPPHHQNHHNDNHGDALTPQRLWQAASVPTLPIIKIILTLSPSPLSWSSPSTSWSPWSSSLSVSSWLSFHPTKTMAGCLGANTSHHQNQYHHHQHHHHCNDWHHHHHNYHLTPQRLWQAASVPTLPTVCKRSSPRIGQDFATLIYNDDGDGDNDDDYQPGWWWWWWHWW